MGPTLVAERGHQVMRQTSTCIFHFFFHEESEHTIHIHYYNSKSTSSSLFFFSTFGDNQALKYYNPWLLCKSETFFSCGKTKFCHMKDFLRPSHIYAQHTIKDYKTLSIWMWRRMRIEIFCHFWTGMDLRHMVSENLKTGSQATINMVIHPLSGIQRKWDIF